MGRPRKNPEQTPDSASEDTVIENVNETLDAPVELNDAVVDSDPIRDELGSDYDDLLLEKEELQQEVARLRFEVESLKIQLQDSSSSNPVPAANPSSTQTPIEYVERVVLTHGYGSPLALRGQTVRVPIAEAEAGELNGSLGSAEQLTAQQSTEGAPLTDAVIDAMTDSEVIAYLNQHSDDESETERIENIEENRLDGPREEVIDAIAAIRMAQL